MKQLTDYSDTREKQWCVHCAAPLEGRTTNREHAPSKVFLDRPLPANLPVFTVCARCNAGFALDEEYTAGFLSAVISGSTDPAEQRTERGRKLLVRQSLRVRIQSSATCDGEGRLHWKPEEDRIRAVLLKNARCHAYYELGVAMPQQAGSVTFRPLMQRSEHERSAFEVLDHPLWPEVGSRMMQRLIEGVDLADGWVGAIPETCGGAGGPW